MTWSRVPPTIHRYRIPEEVVDRTCRFLRARGKLGVEGIVLWTGRMMSDTTGVVTREYVPEQIAYQTEFGLAVEITRGGLTQLIQDLPAETFALVRVHSHGDNAYHSDLDDQNMVISHQGAISVVVADFCSNGLDLQSCSVNELDHGSGGWRELSPEEVKERFLIFSTAQEFD